MTGSKSGVADSTEAVGAEIFPSGQLVRADTLRPIFSTWTSSLGRSDAGDDEIGQSRHRLLGRRWRKVSEGGDGVEPDADVIRTNSVTEGSRRSSLIDQIAECVRVIEPILREPGSGRVRPEESFVEPSVRELAFGDFTREYGGMRIG